VRWKLSARGRVCEGSLKCERYGVGRESRVWEVGGGG